MEVPPPPGHCPALGQSAFSEIWYWNNSFDHGSIFEADPAFRYCEGGIELTQFLANGDMPCEQSFLLWSILKVVFKAHLFYLLSLVFISLSLVLSTYCSPVLIFCFYLYLNLSCLAREFTYCQIRNVIRFALSDVIFLHVIVFVQAITWFRVQFGINKH